MKRNNIRTINGKKHNGHLDIHHQRIQNRASAVLDAYDEFDESMDIDLIAHLHRLPAKQIEQDIYGNPEDFVKRFGTVSSKKFHQAVQKCLAEINYGIDPALASVSNNVPYKTLRDLQQSSNIKEVIDNFFNEMTKLNKHNTEENRKVVHHTSNSNDPLNNTLNQMPLASIENQETIATSNTKEPGDKLVSYKFHKENILFEKGKKRSSNSIINNSSSSCTSEQSEIEEEQHAEPPSKRKKKLYHPIAPLTPSKLKLNWVILNMHGVGLINRDGRRECLNICYINAIIQCLGNAPPFVQWLLNNNYHLTCQLKADDKFCSICLLRSIIMDLHPSFNNKCVSLCNLAQASAVPLSRRLTEISSSFISGEQEDPCEFLVLLLDHLMQCLSSADSSSFVEYMSSPLHSIFGIHIKSLIKCTRCLNETITQNYESLLSIPIISHSNLESALGAFCSEIKLDGDNSIECQKCKSKVAALQSVQFLNVSPVIFINLKRFAYDQNSNITRKLTHFVSYPELLDLMPYIDRHVFESNQDNHQLDKLIYQLCGVLIHCGDTTNNGHIYSYIRSPNDAWYTANDETILPTNLKDVLTSNNSYLLCYVKLSEEKINLSLTEVNSFNTYPANILFSSTPIRPRETAREMINTYSPISTNSVSDISDFDDNSFTNVTRRSCLVSNNYSSNIDENVSSYQASEENLFSSKIHYIPENVLDPIELQTESRIEILPNINRRNEYLNNSNSSDTSSSSLSSASRPTPLSSKKYDSYRNESSKSSNQLTRLSEDSNTNIDLQIDENDEGFKDDDFQIQLDSSCPFKVKSVDLLKLKAIRTKKLNKKRARLFEDMGLPIEADNTSSEKTIFLTKRSKIPSVVTNNTVNKSGNSYDFIEDEKKESRVDVEYLYILLPYIKRFNGYCALCVRNCTFGTTTADRNQLLRCTLYCKARPTCPFTCSVIITNNGLGTIVVSNTAVRHQRGTKIARPIRAPIRDSIKKQFAHGASVFRVFQERLQSRSAHERKANNYDNSGKTRNIIRKIKSEGAVESLLSRDIDQSIDKLRQQYQKDVNMHGKIPGAIQQISKYPCQIIIFTESSIRLFDRLIRLKNTVLSWDATGGIIQEKKNTPRLLYYELSMSLPGLASEDSIVPITFMISDAHALINVIYWMERFKFSYSQVFVGKPFPKPRIVLSDRAQVFLLAALQIWNNESLKHFLQRAYRIVTDAADDDDLDLTFIHACIAHVLVDARKNINNFINKQYRELAMWSIALLVNTSMWNEFQSNWKLICIVFLQLHLDQQHMNHQHEDMLLHKISNLKSDSNIVGAINSSERVEDDDSSNSHDLDTYTFAEDIDDDRVKSTKRLSSSKKKIFLDEEQEANSTNSPFKSVLTKIYCDALSFTGISTDDAFDKSATGILKWFNYLVRYFMPTAPIWSNLLLGDLTRHRRRLVRSFERLGITSCEQRTTAISERRMGILKRTQLGGHIHIRLDIVLSIIVPDMLTMVEQYTNALFSHGLSSQNKSQNNDSLALEERRLKPVEERWRQTSNKRNHGHYTKPPEQPVLTDLVSSLLASQNDINTDLELPSLSPEWLNVAIGLILSTGNSIRNRRSIPWFSSNASPLLDTIKTFVEEWLNSSVNNTHIARSSSINLSLPTDNLNNISEQCRFILEQILIPLLPCHFVVNKIYSCSSCETTQKICCTISSIPVNVLRSGLHLEHDVHAYFAPTSSDIPCAICKKSTTRNIEVVKWPSVLIINVNKYQRNVKSRKPPDMFSLAQFSSWIAGGLPSSMVYDLVCFCSTLQINSTESIVRSTKIKKSWSTSINKRLIGCGDQLKRLFAYSRIMIFERLTSQTEHNLVHAIYKCALDKPFHSSNDILPCGTVQDACSIIQTNNTLQELNNVLSATMKTYYSCISCQNIFNGRLSSIEQIYIFKSSANGQSIAYPIIPDIEDENENNEQHCLCGNSSTANISTQLHKQSFIKHPSCLIAFIDPTSAPEHVFTSKINIYDVKNIEHNYAPNAVLLISRFSDTIVVIKKEGNNYVQCIGNLYSEEVPLSHDQLYDLYDTSATIFAFHHQIPKTSSRTKKTK